MNRRRPKGGKIGAHILDYIPEGFITRRQLADQIGVDYHTIYMWERSGKLIPTMKITTGKVETSCFDASKIEELRIALGIKGADGAGSML